MRSVLTATVAATRSLGEALGELLEPNDVVLLTGELGAGKTVIAKGVADGLGVADAVTSPTFNILLVYPGRLTLNHFDLYRLEHSDQLEDVAYWETLESGGASLVEWGDRFTDSMPSDHLLVSMGIEGDEARRVTLQGSGARGAVLANSLAEAASAIDGVTIEGGSL